MKYTSLHTITNSVLLRQGYPIHWYMQVLKHASDCLRELQFDVIGRVRTKKIEVNEYGAVELPCDYLDYVRIGTPYRDGVKETGEVYTGNRLVSLDATGNKVPYGGSEWAWGDEYGAWSYPDGLHFGAHQLNDGFFIAQERNEIQFRNYTKGGFIILDYITDGSEIDNAVQVDPFAQACIEAYCFWQLKARNRSVGPGEANNEKVEYDRQYRILRGRKSDATTFNIKTVMAAAYGKAK